MTTLIIDSTEGVIVTDSRGSWEESDIKLTWKGVLPKISRDKTDMCSDNTQKVYTAGRHLITGCGSLKILQFIVKRADRGLLFTNDTLKVKSYNKLSSTTVYISKRCKGSCHTIMLNIEPKSTIFPNIYKLVVTKTKYSRAVIIDGSGKEFATGAYDNNGGDAQGAVRTAIKHDKYSGGELQIHRLR